MDGLTRINLLSNDFHDFLSLDNGLPCLMPLHCFKQRICGSGSSKIRMPMSGSQMTRCDISCLESS